MSETTRLRETSDKEIEYSMTLFQAVVVHSKWTTTLSKFQVVASFSPCFGLKQVIPLEIQRYLQEESFLFEAF